MTIQRFGAQLFSARGSLATFKTARPGMLAHAITTAGVSYDLKKQQITVSYMIYVSVRRKSVLCIITQASEHVQVS